MTLIRTILAWIAVTAVVTVMAPIVMLVNCLFLVIAAPLAGFFLAAYALEEGISEGGGDKWVVANNRLSAVSGVVIGTPTNLMRIAIENVYLSIHS